MDGDDDDDNYDKESITSTNTDIFETFSSDAITTSPPVLPIEDPEVSLIIGNEKLNTIPEKESYEFINSSVEDLVPIPSESEETSESDSECILPSCDYFSPIDVPEEESDVLENNVKIYLNPLFKFDNEYISSDVNPLFDDVMRCKSSIFLVTPLFDSNEDEYFTPGDDVELLLHHDPSTPKMSVASILDGFTDEPPFEENDDLFDLESKNVEWKKILVTLIFMILSLNPFVEIPSGEIKVHQGEYNFYEYGYFETPSSDAITTSPLVLQIKDPEVSLIMRNEKLNTIPEKESDEFINSSVEDLVPILSESEETSGSDSECILPSCDYFSPFDIPEEESVTFSNPLFNSNDDIISSDDESPSDEDVPEDNVKIYSNPIFKFDDEYISSDVNPLFDEVMRCKSSIFLVTPLFDYNEDEYFTLGDDVELLLHHDPSIPKMSVASILDEFIDEPPFEENDDLFDLESKNVEWKKILYDAQIDDLMSEDKIFNPGICVKFFSPTYVSLPFTDRHYLFLTYVV
nr:hypothetical protein [Tanacetum cinerariifolium]